MLYIIAWFVSRMVCNVLLYYWLCLFCVCISCHDIVSAHCNTRQAYIIQLIQYSILHTQVNHHHIHTYVITTHSTPQCVAMTDRITSHHTKPNQSKTLHITKLRCTHAPQYITRPTTTIHNHHIRHRISTYTHVRSQQQHTIHNTNIYGNTICHN